MYFAIYPTDPPQVRELVVANAKFLKQDFLFTSLHIPESRDLKNYLRVLKDINSKYGFYFCADISPLALEKLEIDIANIKELKKFAIEMLRIDFGFSLDQIKQIQKQIPIAINASVCSEDLIINLSPKNLTAWHNYYPRPQTALNKQYFNKQNLLFKKYDIDIYVFIPGQNYFRAPLHLGLPTLEHQRNKNPYVNFLDIDLHYSNLKVVCSEGNISMRDLNLIYEYKTQNIINIPAKVFDKEAKAFLRDKVFLSRAEETDFSWRFANACLKNYYPRQTFFTARKKASLQMDNQKYPRYQGQLHIIKNDLNIDDAMTHIGDISTQYAEIAGFDIGAKNIKFIID